MMPKYCKYCGLPLNEKCNCERIVVEEYEDFLEDYYDNPETQYGWYQQDIIEMRRREQ